MTYSPNFRKCILAINEEDALTYKQTAINFKIEVASLIRWNRNLHPKTKHNKSPVEIDNDKLWKDVRQYCDDFQDEYAARFYVSLKGIGINMKRLGITRKKDIYPPENTYRSTISIPKK